MGLWALRLIATTDKWTIRTRGSILPPQYGQRAYITCGCHRASNADCPGDSCDSTCALLRIADFRPVSPSLLPFCRDRCGVAVVRSRAVKLERMAGGEGCSSGGSR